MDFPEAFTQQMQSLLGQSEWQAMLAALEQKPSVSIRVNPFKGTKEQLAILNSQFSISSVQWSSMGKYLSERPDFTLDPAFHAGAYYVQEASSMFLEQAVRQCPTPQVVLDLCAAPGGKSTLLRSLLPDDTLLVANEPIKSRANILRENIIKWGHEGTVVTCNYPKDFAKLGPTFDIIVVDAPCSGEGMFRKDNPALEMWSPANVELCAERQREIVETIWPTLNPGGHLIYSTCTYNTRENEENVRYFCQTLGAQTVEIPVKTEWNITGSLLPDFPEPVYRFMPHKTRGEGFFLAMIKKEGTLISKPHPHPKPDLDDNVQCSMLNVQCLINSLHQPIISRLIKHLYPLHMGIAVSEKKGNKTLPHHSLAMSRNLSPDAYPTADLTLEQALSYLRHEAIRIDGPKGYTIVRYNGMPLGFVNNLGNRANNLYPAEWRIRRV